MNANVLVLNKDYQPLSVCSVERSVKLMFLDKAELVHEHPSFVLRTVSDTYAYPSVIRLNRYIRIPYQRIVLSRKNVIKRDRHRCQYCGSTKHLTIDHVLPKSRGGKDTWENLVAACSRCNLKKGDNTPEEANMPLEREPFRPNHISFLRDLFSYNGHGVHDAWKPYLYMV
jgi:5-methylcytosine-specific restriction endonuclease McrA